MAKELGELSHKYEVGPKGSIATISTGIGDPGGKSYGLWQIASKTGTLDAFVKKSHFPELRNSPLASAEFDTAWKKLCFEHPEEFRQEQWHFIKTTHFDPIFTYWNNELKMAYNNTIGQVLWSISVQHGKAKTILANTKQALSSYSTYDLDILIKELYNQRGKYVKKYLQGNVLQGVLNRYTSELKDALSLLKEETTSVVVDKPVIVTAVPTPSIIKQVEPKIGFFTKLFNIFTGKS